MGKKYLSAVVLYVVLACSFLVAQDNERINALLTEADGLIASNNLPEALIKTRQAIALSPSNHIALQKQINIHFLMNDEKESLQLVDDAIKKYPEVAAYHYLRGIVNNSREKYSKALDDFSKAIDIGSPDILYRCYLGRGVSYLNLLEYDQALADLTSSIEHNDTVASAYYSRAMVNYELLDYSAAINDFNKSLEFAQGNAALYFNLGMSYYRLNEKEKACPNFNKSCTMGNTNACRMFLMECAKAIPNLP